MIFLAPHNACQKTIEHLYGLEIAGFSWISCRNTGQRNCNCKRMVEHCMKPGTTYFVEPIEQMSKTVEMQLILGTTPESNWQAISESFELAGWAASQNISEACQLNAKTQASDGRRFLLLHSYPIEAIAHTIANGTPLEQAKETWLTAAKQMVEFYTRHRKQAAMVYIPYLLAEPKAQLAAITSHLGLTDLPQPTISIKAEQAPLLERLLVSQLLQQNPEIATLLSRIEACTIPQTGHSYKASPLDLYAANRQLKSFRINLEKRNEQLSELSLQSKQLQEENDLLLKQLHVVQEELEAKYFSHDQLEVQMAQLKKMCTESERETVEHREQQDNALAFANHQILSLQSELNRVKSSTTFKATAPVRVLTEKYKSAPAKSALKKQAELIRQSGLFIEGWYLKTYPDVAERGVDPIMHYLEFGAAELRNPSPEFDTRWYLANHPDVAEVNMNPFLHYCMFGEKEGRKTNSQDHQYLSVPAAA